MHLSSIFTAVATSAVTVAAFAVNPTFGAKCSTATPVTDEAQFWALKDFANSLFILRDVQKGFDDWIPGTYINHNPQAEQGRDFAIPFLTTIFSNPDLNTTLSSVFAGQGFGLIHHRLTIPGQFDMAVMDRFRFNGTCIVEHWDVVQTITGTEPNPIAYF